MDPLARLTMKQRRPKLPVPGIRGDITLDLNRHEKDNKGIVETALCH